MSINLIIGTAIGSATTGGTIAVISTAGEPIGLLLILTKAA